MFNFSALDSCVRFIDIREPHTCDSTSVSRRGCENAVIRTDFDIYSISIDPISHETIAIAGRDRAVWLFDRRNLHYDVKNPRPLTRYSPYSLRGNSHHM